MTTTKPKAKSKAPPKVRADARLEAKSGTLPQIVLSASRDIPFDKLRLSQSNVRGIKNGVTIEQLAEDIAQRTLLQSLSVRAILDDGGQETGLYEVPAGGRRFRALELLVKRKRLPKTALVPCVVRTDGLAEEDSLAENSQRETLHPLDQFRAFKTLREKGLSEDEIAARFFVSGKTVKQRLKLAAVSPELLTVYADGDMALEQLEAFTVTNNHARQEQAWEQISRGFNKQPWQIRNLLTQSAVSASDSRALFIGLAAYEAAGGAILRDLFSKEGEGWLEDVALVDRLVKEKLEQAAEAVRAEGWKWVEACPDFAYGHTHGLLRIKGEIPKTTKQDRETRKALEAEFKKLGAEYDRLQDAIDQADDETENVPEIPDELRRRLDQIEADLDGFDDNRTVYAPKDLARGGAFVSIDESGILKVERGYAYPKEKAPGKADPDAGDGADGEAADRRAVFDIGANPSETGESDNEDETKKGLSERIMTELSQYRTLALRDALAENPETAYLAVLHTLCLSVFHSSGLASCLDIEAKSAAFMQPAAGLGESSSAKAIDARHQAWGERLPGDPSHLWNALARLDATERAALLAHCVGLTVNALHDPWRGRMGGLAHAGQVAQAVGLDMAAAGWKPTVENYLGRVSKARIIEAVAEAKGDIHAKLIAHLKKGDMAKEAERMLDGAGWLPEPLRTPGEEMAPSEASGSADTDDADLPDFLDEAIG